MFLTKKSDGSYWPSYGKDAEESAKVKAGKEVRVTRARNAKHHRKFFAILDCAFQNQVKFTDEEMHRQVILMKAGHVHFAPGTDGQLHPLPKSISFENLGQGEFEKLYNTCLVILAAEMGVTVEELAENSENYM